MEKRCSLFGKFVSDGNKSFISLKPDDIKLNRVSEEQKEFILFSPEAVFLVVSDPSMNEL